MAIDTLEVAWRRMRRLGYTNTTRLVGVSIEEAWRLPNASHNAKGWPEELTTLLAAAGADHDDPPVYVVISEGVPVCWLTGEGVVTTGTAALTRTQARHRDHAAAALSELYRHTLARLAERCAAAEGRHDDEQHGDRPGSLWIAHPSRPARAWWVHVDGDLETARHHVAEVTGTDQPLIITAFGYGDYGRESQRLRLEVLCAINRTAEAHELPASVVGNWVATDERLSDPPDADGIPAAFSEAYLGRFSDQLTYTAHRIEELGWAKTLREIGAWDFLDIRAVDWHLFTYEVHAIRDDSPGGGIIVCRRHQPG